jgi:hypothetical protein
MSASNPPDLSTIQRWMQSVITHPDGVAAGVASDAARQQIDLDAGSIESLIGRSQSQTSLERLQIYSNAYQARLIEVLKGEYPALVHALGDEAFIGLATEYLQAYPPASYTLSNLGRSFPDFLAQTRPEHDDEDGSPDWADFLIDLARLERCYSEVFDGPGIEGQSFLQADQLRSLAPDEWLMTRLIPAPCLRLNAFRFAVHEYASAIRQNREADDDFATPRPTFLAITRRDYIVRRASLPEPEYRVLSSLISGRTVGTALNVALANHPDSCESLAQQVNLWFRHWSAVGYFSGWQNSDIHG